MPSMARSACACCAGPWTLGDFTKRFSSAIRHSCRSWQTGSYQLALDVSLWGTSQVQR
jgi:hypothetical protein